jgi:hydrogenase maturation protein HypF
VASDSKEVNTYQIFVKGLVQGVGFRPFIYRLAHRFSCPGHVENRNDGVHIKINATTCVIESFLTDLRKEAPPASVISSVSCHKADFEQFPGFRIITSRNLSPDITEVSPDIAVCDECLADIKRQENRLDYPFVNCTNCGPRFSIIRDLPYDRENTTMKPFIMCKQCESEYKDVLDRRFHAQPVACLDCGPEYQLNYQGSITSSLDDILEQISELLKDGRSIAVKGIGGFQLICDGTNQDAVLGLRTRKNREGKPFAVMFRDLETLLHYAVVSKEEKESLLSWKRPIVIVRERLPLAGAVSLGFGTVGAILPYMPFHYQLFEHCGLPALVFTSGNLSEEPIMTSNEEACGKLLGIAHAVLTYNRDIVNRLDDSVVHVVRGQESIIRRSRGFAPRSVDLSLDVDGILATGAEMANCFCMGKGKQALLSQHIGDLKNLGTFEFYTETLARFRQLFRTKAGLAACDLHPDYLSTRYAESLSVPLVKVQHHHAHIASCMAENNLDERVIGVAFDGTGYGDDGNTWGSEFFLCDLSSYKRMCHFEYLPIPGGDKATEQPWRTALSVLYRLYGNSFTDFPLEFLRSLRKEETALVLQALEKRLNCPLSSSAGRYFDAVAALTGLCINSKFHAEAPMRLESVITEGISEAYDFDAGDSVSFDRTFKQVVRDLADGLSVGEISARFHNMVTNVIFAVVSKIRSQSGVDKVALSGGTFQNKYLSEKIIAKLDAADFKVFFHSGVPANDGGIALGQLVVAAKKRSLTCV